MKLRFLRLNLLLFAVIVALGVVLWHRYYYDPQVATLRAMPKRHYLARRINADVDGDGVQEVVFTSGPDSSFDKEAVPATLTVLHWRGWHWRRVWSFTSRREEGYVTIADVNEDGDWFGDKRKTLRIEDINGDGHEEIIFRSQFGYGTDSANYFHLFGCRKGRYVSLLTAPLWHFMQGGVVIKDFDPKRQGKEILRWTFLWDLGRESHSAPHRLYATFLAWDGKQYKPYKWVETKQRFAEDDRRVLRALLDPSAVIVRAKPRPEMEKL